MVSFVCAMIPHVQVQVVMPDADYRQQANELAIALSEPHVKGVFEERLPLDLHAALHLGCVTAVIPESRSKSMQDGFELSDLQVAFTSPDVMPIYLFCYNFLIYLFVSIYYLCIYVFIYFESNHMPLCTAAWLSQTCNTTC